ncbi:hypothetical protein AVEN_120410-1 [Araneus ventricosus]|uniref:Uncharacterized protein n=1 Tax=Araneus ventricosus TaxID=182803 RepID=A0A4Y2MWE1_ARAVE|nr:hypothetical protein AVEN_120410-1 [Araneus ventricosus]
MEPWTEVLPTILLGLRATFRRDLQCTPSGFVYGKAVRVPGEFFESATGDINTPDFVKSLRNCMQQLKPTQTRVQQRNRIFVPMDLMTCTHLFVRYDAVRAPLRPSYDGPFLVIDRTDKFFRIQREGKIKVVAIDKLKPAFMLLDTLAVPASANDSSKTFIKVEEPISQAQTSRSGRKIRRPVRFPSPPARRGGGTAASHLTRFLSPSACFPGGLNRWQY